MVASGPFTQSDTMTYQPLEDLVKYVQEHQPHLLILTGPFLDAVHPQIQDTQIIAESFNDSFDKIVDALMRPLAGSVEYLHMQYFCFINFCQFFHAHKVFVFICTFCFNFYRCHTEVVLVPSSRDVHHHGIYPTPPYVLRKSYPRLHLMPDPALLDVSGILIGITATDVLKHFGRSEVCK